MMLDDTTDTVEELVPVVTIEPLGLDTTLWLSAISHAGGGLVPRYRVVRREGDRLTHVFPVASDDPGELVDYARRMCTTWAPARFAAPAVLVAAAALTPDCQELPA